MMDVGTTANCALVLDCLSTSTAEYVGGSRERVR
jgi:hypothetical protein